MNKSKLKILSILLSLSIILCFFASCNADLIGGENASLDDILKNYRTKGIVVWWEILAIYNAGENPMDYKGFEQIYLSLEGDDYLKTAAYVIVADIAVKIGADEGYFEKYGEYKTKLKNFLENPSEQYTLYEYIYAYYGLKCSGTVFDQTPLLDYFIKEQKSDGGFALFGNVSDADMTALVIPVLQLLYTNPSGMYFDTDISPLTNAVKFLESQIGENGMFSYSGEDNANSTACALTALVGYYKDDGNANEIIKKASDGLSLFRVNKKAEYAYLKNGKADILATAQAAIALGDLKNKMSVWEKLYLEI